MLSRRKFVIKTTLASALAMMGFQVKAGKKFSTSQSTLPITGGIEPIVLSTWKHGMAANAAAWEVLKNKGRSLDAVEQGVMVPEADPNVSSVGYGGMPDRDGRLTLDASIMDEFGNCGAVAFLEHIKHPISVARMVMEKTPHILLVGEGAYRFAIANNFPSEDLLTPNAKQRWEKWKDEHKGESQFIDQHNHDTIGMIARDMHGNLSGACTTSGLAWKYHGRVGDSPLIGSGLYVDNEIGAATATGKGEEVIKIAGSFLIVELMRNGRTPQEACEEAIKRIAKRSKGKEKFQVGFLALDKAGNHGAYSLNKGFQYAMHAGGKNTLIDSEAAISDQK